MTIFWPKNVKSPARKQNPHAGEDLQSRTESREKEQTGL